MGVPLAFEIANFTPGLDSPLIDQGDAASAPPLDALGTPRPQGAAADIGAVEFAPEPAAAMLAGVATGLLAVLARRRCQPLRRDKPAIPREAAVLASTS